MFSENLVLINKCSAMAEHLLILIKTRFYLNLFKMCDK